MKQKVRTVTAGNIPTAPTMPGTGDLVCMTAHMIFLPAEAGFMAPLPWTCSALASQAKRELESKLRVEWKTVSAQGYTCDPVRITRIGKGSG